MAGGGRGRQRRAQGKRQADLRRETKPRAVAAALVVRVAERGAAREGGAHEQQLLRGARDEVTKLRLDLRAVGGRERGAPRGAPARERAGNEGGEVLVACTRQPSLGRGVAWFSRRRGAASRRQRLSPHVPPWHSGQLPHVPRGSPARRPCTVVATAQLQPHSADIHLREVHHRRRRRRQRQLPILRRGHVRAAAARDRPHVARRELVPAESRWP